MAECLRERPAFVLVEGIVLLQFVDALQKAVPAIPVIIDMHNVESKLRLQTEVQRVSRILRPLAPLILAVRDWNGPRAERRSVEAARQVWVCSENDKKEAEDLFVCERLSVVPNPIPDWAQQGPARAAEQSQEVLFLGHLSYFPNLQAVEILCKDIMPRLQQLVPEAQLHVCGKRPCKSIEVLVQSLGHRLTTNPLDLAQVYATAAVTAIPLQVGGGTRLKGLEAMAVGCPVVATAKAVEGLGLIPQEHYRLAETPEEFAREIAWVMASPAAASEMSEQARNLALDRYGARAHLSAVRTALVSAGLL
ncbi:glycosyltransferase [Rhizobium sp. PAMB 3174]